MARNILIQYLEWQYLDSPLGILRGWKNCLKFNLNYWSLPLLLKTLFSHWRRYHYSYGRGIDIKRYLEAFTFNLISRILGAFMRSVFIVFGLLTEVVVLAAGLILLFFWLALPLLLIFGFIFGFKILF